MTDVASRLGPHRISRRSALVASGTALESTGAIGATRNASLAAHFAGAPLVATLVHEAVEFRADDTPGFWEVAGYHNHGDPWNEQRYSGD